MTQRDAVAGEDDGAPAAVRAAGIVKSFAGVQALRAVDFDLLPMEVHALVGENGAGKSTLAKIISGAYSADDGTLWVNGAQLGKGNPRGHAAAGIAMVYQEPKLVPELTAAANVLLGKSVRRGRPFVARRSGAARLRRLAETVGIDIDPNARAGDLTLAKQRMLDVIRALDSDARVLIMDEPSAALGPVERDSLYRTMERLRERSVTILYISHDLDEVFRLADRITVMRDGAIVATRATSEWTKTAVVEAMLGRDFVVPKRHKVERREVEEVLRVEGLTVPGALAGIDLTLRRGEVLGIAGLVGSGRSTLLRALAGAERRAYGRLAVEGRAVPWPRTVRRAVRYGLGFSPEDRRRYGLVLGMTGSLNVSLTNMNAVSAGGFILPRKLARHARRAVTPFAFRPERLRALAGTLSGGNQQKLVVAKTLARGPRILLLDEPTAGIDVGAKAEMFGIIDTLAAEGLSVLFASSELEEVVEISDRILVIGRGRSLGVLEGPACSVREILGLAFGVDQEGEAA